MPYSLHPEPSRRRLITPDGFLTTDPNAAIPADPDERMVFARRLVADRCLYGVDKNPLAVEMAKLSLWLITLAKGQPFSFLDHALRAGDSLLGVGNVRQILNWDLAASDDDRGAYRGFLTQPLERALERAGALRRRIQSTPVRDARDAEQKQRWLHEAEDAMGLVRLAADLLIAAQLHKDKKRRAELSEEFQVRLSVAATAWEDARRDPTLRPTGNRAELAALRREADELLAGRTPFHWPLEFPEAFDEGIGDRVSGMGENASIGAMLEAAQNNTLYPIPNTRGAGFAAVVGNPPFQGGQKITGALGVPYRDYLVEYLANGQRGSADLCAYFFLRGGELVRQRGQLGLIATNTIAQGDTREVGLAQLVAHDLTIPRAVPSRPWPGTAALEVAHVWLRRGNWQANFLLNDQQVNGITPFLTVPGTASGNPYRLKANESKSFQGSIVLGMGFVLEPDEAAELITKDSRNRDVLFPYLNGEDLNSRLDQSPSRWVINFHDWPLERAETYPDVLKIVREKAKPGRDRLANGDSTARDRAARWWQFGRPTMLLYNTIKELDRILVKTQVSRYWTFEYASPGIVFDQRLIVFADEHITLFMLLQSEIHWTWASQYSSTMKQDMSYTPTDVFQTFPLIDERLVSVKVGILYHELRSKIMKQRSEGLTKVTQRISEPTETSADIAELRRLHAEMDNAVAAAYGWADLDLGHGFHDTKQGLRYTISEAARRTVLDRLLALNHERYAEEVAAGLHEKKKGIGDRVSGIGKKGRKKSPEPQTPNPEPQMEQGEMF